MVEEVLNSPINTAVNIVTLSVMGLLIIIFYYKFSKILSFHKDENSPAKFNRRFVIGFTSLIFTVSIMLSILMAVTAIAKNMLLAANGLFPNINSTLFLQIFPDYNETNVRAFIFSNFIPIVRTCILCYGPLYFFIELNYWGSQPDWRDSPSHMQFLGKWIKQDKIGKTKFICGLISIFVVAILPISLFIFFITVDTGFPFNFAGEYRGIGDAYLYLAPFLTEIIASFYLSYYSMIQISEYLRPSKVMTINTPESESTQKQKKPSKFGLRLLQIVGIYYLIQILISFIKMIFVLNNFTWQEIVSNDTIFTFLLYFYPNSIPLQVLNNIFIIFPIDFLLAWLLGFVFALKFLFHKIVGKDTHPKPRDLFFLCFIICGFITLLAYKFMVNYPWMYASSITGTVFSFSLNTADKYYPKIIAEKVFSLIFLIKFMFLKKKQTNL